MVLSSGLNCSRYALNSLPQSQTVVSLIAGVVVYRDVEGIAPLRQHDSVSQMHGIKLQISVLLLDHIDTVVPLDLCQLGFKFRYLVLVILRLPPEVQSAEDKEVLVLTGLVATDCAREGLVPAKL